MAVAQVRSASAARDHGIHPDHRDHGARGRLEHPAACLAANAEAREQEGDHVGRPGAHVDDRARRELVTTSGLEPTAQPNWIPKTGTIQRSFTAAPVSHVRAANCCGPVEGSVPGGKVRSGESNGECNVMGGIERIHTSRASRLVSRCHWSSALASRSASAAARTTKRRSGARTASQPMESKNPSRRRAPGSSRAANGPWHQALSPSQPRRDRLPYGVLRHEAHARLFRRTAT